MVNGDGVDRGEVYVETIPAVIVVVALSGGGEGDFEALSVGTPFDGEVLHGVRGNGRGFTFCIQHGGVVCYGGNSISHSADGQQTAQSESK